MSCSAGSDNLLGPRVNLSCRPFDFTLLFEDALFTVLLTSLFFLAATARLSVLVRAPVKVNPHRLAAWKLVRIYDVFILDNSEILNGVPYRLFSACYYFSIYYISHFASRTPIYTQA
jgi:hypothetical protein